MVALVAGSATTEQASTSGGVSGGTTSAPVALPTGVTTGNAVVMWFAADRGDTTALTIAGDAASTAGWVEVDTGSGGGTGNGSTGCLAYMICDLGSPGATAGVTGLAFDDNWSSITFEVEDFDPDSFVDAFSLTYNGSSDDPTGETLGTAPAADSAVFGFLAHERRDITATPGTELARVNGGSLSQSAGACQYANGSTGGGTWTTDAADDNVTAVLAINNASAGGGIAVPVAYNQQRINNRR